MAFSCVKLPRLLATSSNQHPEVNTTTRALQNLSGKVHVRLFEDRIAAFFWELPQTNARATLPPWFCPAAEQRQSWKRMYSLDVRQVFGAVSGSVRKIQVAGFWDARALDCFRSSGLLEWSLV